MYLKALLFVSWFASAPAIPWVARCKNSDIPGYSCKLLTARGLTTYFAVDTTNSTLSVRIATTQHVWLGWAASKTGKMNFGDAIIADPLKESVTRFHLGYHEVGGPRLLQDIVDFTISTGTYGLVAEFRRPLAATAYGGVSIVNGNNTFLYAIGASNVFDRSVPHKESGSYIIDLSNVFSFVPSPTPDASATPTPSQAGPVATPTPSYASPTSAPVVPFGSAGACLRSVDYDYPYGVMLATDYKMWWTVNENAGTLSVKLQYTGSAWLGWGPSPDGYMIGSTVVIGLPGDGVFEYSLDAKSPSGVTRIYDAGLTDTAVTQIGGLTTVTFTRPLAPTAPGQLPTPATGEFFAVFAHGISNVLAQHQASASSGLKMSLDRCGAEVTPPDFSLRNAHGWLMSCSFGFLLPVGALVSRFGRRFERHWWFKTHRAIQVLGLLGGIMGIFVGFAMVNKEYGGEHLKETHNKTGAAIATLVLLQVFWAVLRPKKTGFLSSSEGAVEAPVTAAPMATVNGFTSTMDGTPDNHDVSIQYKHRGHSEMTQSKSRIFWEWAHWGLGWVVVIWSVVQVFTGLKLIEGQVSGAYKTAYGSVITVLLGVGVVLQLSVCCKRRRPNPENF